METNNYLSERVESEMKYYSNRSKLNKRWYHTLKTTETIVAVSIPFISGILSEECSLKLCIGLLGVLLAVISSVQVIFKPHEKWITYRTTLESLKQEKYMFMNGAGPYANNQTLQELTERIETILAKENATWNQMLSKKSSTT